VKSSCVCPTAAIAGQSRPAWTSAAIWPLLKIDATDLPAVSRRHDQKLRVGEWLLAIGSPFGFRLFGNRRHRFGQGSQPDHRTVRCRSSRPTSRSTPAIPAARCSTLAAKWVRRQPQFSETGGYMGVSFAIPNRVAAKAARELKEHARSPRGWLGLVVQEVRPRPGAVFRMKKPEGALISRIVPAGRPSRRVSRPATSFSATTAWKLATRPAPRPPLVGNSDPGAKAQLRLMRDGKVIDMPVEVGTLDSEPPTPPRRARRAGGRPRRHAGRDGCAALTADERRRAQVVSGGVWVAESSEGAGADAGLRKGDIVCRWRPTRSTARIACPRSSAASSGPAPRRCWCKRRGTPGVPRPGNPAA